MASRMPVSLLRQWVGFRTWERTVVDPEPTKWDPTDVKREKLERKVQPGGVS